MARPKSIPWQRRVSVFLEYRRNGGKVFPIANHYQIARSTVNVIVKEFDEMGFSDRPRAKLAPELLREMQRRHIESVMEYGEVGNLNLGPGTSDEVGRQEAMANPIPLDETFDWHIRGSKAEELVREEIGAARDYLSRESEAWSALSQTLQSVCGLPERDSPIRKASSPHMFPALKHKLAWAFHEASFRDHLPPPDWLEWDTAPDQPTLLALQREPVAVGREADHDRIKQGIASFLADGFRQYQRRFIDLARLRRDLKLLRQIADETYKSIGETEIRQGICPECPYPEAREDADVVVMDGGPTTSGRQQ